MRPRPSPKRGVQENCFPPQGRGAHQASKRDGRAPTKRRACAGGTEAPLPSQAPRRPLWLLGRRRNENAARQDQLWPGRRLCIPLLPLGVRRKCGRCGGALHKQGPCPLSLLGGASQISNFRLRRLRRASRGRPSPPPRAPPSGYLFLSAPLALEGGAGAKPRKGYFVFGASTGNPGAEPQGLTQVLRPAGEPRRSSKPVLWRIGKTMQKPTTVANVAGHPKWSKNRARRLA